MDSQKQQTALGLTDEEKETLFLTLNPAEYES